jgi:hypothetical protein
VVTKAAEPKRDTNSKTAQLVKLISEIGPDIPEIARRLGQYKESVRYRYKEKILSRGMVIQAAVDHERIGLKRVVFIAQFAAPFQEYAQAILAAMSDNCYVSGFEEIIPDGSYLVNASVPTEFVETFKGFIRTLEVRGLFRCDGIVAFDWFRTIPMMAELYDFDTGRWDFDWSRLGRPRVWHYTPTKGFEFDYTDLLILKELRIDASRSLTEIAEKLGRNYKVLTWHYHTHVKARELIKGYSLNWMGTRYDFKLEKALHRKHRYFRLDLLVENISEMEGMELMSKTNALPFLWAEAGGSDYWAQFAFPVDNIVEAYQFLQNALTRVKDRAHIFVMNPANALSFTISYKLYNEHRRAWSFESERLAAKFEQLLLKIKNGAG